MTIQAPLVDPAWRVEITGVAVVPPPRDDAAAALASAP